MALYFSKESELWILRKCLHPKVQNAVLEDG